MGAIYPNPYVLNIIDLQNTITNAGGRPATASLQQQITALQGMVNTTSHTIYADTLRDFSGTGVIGVAADLNLTTNAVTGEPSGLYSNGTAIGGTGTTSLTNGTNGAFVGSNTIAFGVVSGGSTIMSVDTSGIVTATQFVTLSDELTKKHITRIEGARALEGILQLEPAKWEWKEFEGAKGVGLLAGEVESAFPELGIVSVRNGQKHIDIAGMVGVIVAAIQELEKRCR